MDEMSQVFRQEAEELLVEMEDALLALEDAPNSKEFINALFRAMHTIKGAAGVFSFNHIVEFTHPIETEIEKLRNGNITLSSELIATLLKCKDHTQVLVLNALSDEHDLPSDIRARGDSLLRDLDCNTTSNTDSVDGPSGAESSSTHNQTDKDQWVISLDFKQDALRNGLDPLSFIRYLKELGQISDILTVTNQLPRFQEIDFESCYLGYRIVLISSASKAEIEAVFEFAQEDAEIKIIPSRAKVGEFLETLENLNSSESERLGELLLKVGAITQHELNKALGFQAEASSNNVQQQIGEVLLQQQSVDKTLVDGALKKQQQSREQTQSIRVDSDKLGQLINLVGELVTANAAMKIMVEQHQLSDMSDVAANVDQLVEEIRDNALQLRMVQIGETFTRFRRVTRDVSKELGKEIELIISGGEAELDKVVVEKINDPLTHLIRNALDHGIELPDVRLAAGKPALGTVTLNAFHDSGHIVIEVIDDGGGLDPDKIRAKAERLGIIEPNQVLSRAETFRLIFEAGLSTKTEASNLSGRGVGMDVVKRNIEALRGNIELDSEVGKGTKVTINLPLTLAIIDGFMVGVGSERYIIPLGAVEECVEISDTNLIEKQQHHFINLRDEVMPFVRLRHFFGCHDKPTKKRESLVVVRMGRHKAGFVVDQLFGEQQTVIKPLGGIFKNLQGISGATMLGTGEIALILDIQSMIELAVLHSKNHTISSKTLQINHVE